MKKLRLFSEFMTSQTGKQVIKIHILPNISRSKDNQTMNLTWEMFFWINHLATHQVICIRYFLYILIMLNLTFLKCFLKTFQTFLKSFKHYVHDCLIIFHLLSALWTMILKIVLSLLKKGISVQKNTANQN